MLDSFSLPRLVSSCKVWKRRCDQQRRAQSIFDGRMSHLTAKTWMAWCDYRSSLMQCHWEDDWCLATVHCCLLQEELLSYSYFEYLEELSRNPQTTLSTRQLHNLKTVHALMYWWHMILTTFNKLCDESVVIWSHMSCTVDRKCSVRSRNTGTSDFLLRGQLSGDALPCNAGLFRLVVAHEVRCRKMDGSIIL